MANPLTSNQFIGGETFAFGAHMATVVKVRPHSLSSFIPRVAATALCGATALMLLAPSQAAAQPGATLKQSPAVEPTVEPARTGYRAEQDLDPNVDQGFILPTAFLQPEGTYKFQSREVFLVGVQKTFGDRFQASVNTLALPAISLLVEMKLRLWSGDRTHVALSGHAGVAAVPTVGIVGATGGLVVTRCFNTACGHTVTVTAMIGRLLAGGESAGDTITGLQFGLAFQGRVGPKFKFIAEGLLSYFRGPDEGDESLTSLQIFGGVRAHGKRGAIDFGLMFIPDLEPNQWDYDTTDHIFAPWLNISYRWR